MKRKIIALTLLAMLFTMAGCNKDNSSETNSSKIDEIEPSNNNEANTKETNESIFDKWEEIELSTGKIEGIKFYGYNQFDVEEFIAFGKDNYVYGRVYDETNNKYYYSTSGNKWKFIEDSIISIHRGTEDYRYLVYGDMLIALDGLQTYYKKGEPEVIDYDKMVLELEINGKSVDVTWENNDSVKELKKRALRGLTIYFVNKGYHQIFKSLDFDLNNGGSLSEVKIGEIRVETNYFVLFYDTPIIPETGENIKSSGELIGKINMNFEELASLINSKDTVTITFNLK